VAIYHFAVKVISRNSSKSAVASAAYRSGDKLTDERQSVTFDYHKKEVAYSEIVLPKNAPVEYANRATLWNAVEKIEKQANAMTAREWEVAIPNELNLEQSKYLVKNFAQSLADEGICVDCNIHWKSGNHHAHILGTTRPLKKDGTWGTKERKGYALDKDGNKIPLIDETTGKQKVRVRPGKGVEKLWLRETIEVNNWNTKEKLLEWRKRWADMVNSALAKAKIADRVDYRSNKDRGLLDQPTIHEGFRARQIEMQGGVSERCEINRCIKRRNAELHEILQQLAVQQAELDKILQEEREHDERIRKFLERRAAFRATGADAERIRLSTGGESSIPAGNSGRSDDSYDTTAREIADRERQINKIIERREREAAEARRQREEAERRKRESEEAERRARAEAQKRAEDERRCYSWSEPPDRGFSR